MKAKNFLPLFLSAVFWMQDISAQILTNGGFENWATGPSGFLDPVGWNTNNGSNTNGLPTVVQAPGNTGNYSVNLITVPDASTQYLGGNIHINYSGNIIPLDISGYWKGIFLPGNTNQIILEIMTYDINFVGNGLAGISTPLSTNLPNWTYFNVPVNYSNGLPLSSTNIFISLKGDTTTIEGFLDDLVMTYSTPTGEIRTMQIFGSSLVQDLTGNYLLNIDLLSPTTFSLNIFSADGRKVSKKKYSLGSGNHQIPVYTHELNDGIYFCHIAGDRINKTFKFIK